MKGMTHPHVEPPPIPLIKETHDGKSNKDFVELKLCRDPTPFTLDLYEIKMALFERGELEEFLLFIRNFKLNLAASGTLKVGTKYQYLCTLVCRDALLQFDLLHADVEVTQTLNIDYIIKGLSQYFTPCKFAIKTKASHAPWKKKPRALTVRRYAARQIGLNEYLASFPGATLNKYIGVTELNEIPINSMPNSRSRQAYVQGFNCESVTFKMLLIYLSVCKLPNIFMKV